ncbi:MAG: N-acetyl-alpha-D-glucosaminyl L-malate synthase BshA [Gemmatimonadota bacterium]|nr:N-acetyl-alpha-D-glucosaminyl L-malate synthase BshA [Gemmatimonadota bacterium]
MKVGITCYPTYGGSGAVATELGIGLAARGHEVHFISYAQPFRLSGFRERVYFHEVEMEQYPLFERPHYTLALAAAIHDTARRERLDLIHVHYAIPHATSAWIAQEMLEENGGPPLVTTLHGTDVTLVGLHPSFHPITRFSIMRSQGVTAVSRFLKEVTVRDFSVPEERIRVIPNFVDTDVFRRGRDPSHREVFAPRGEKIVMHVSNFRPVKRVIDVIEVFAGLRAAVPARLVMAGDGPDRPRAAARARELGVDRDVVFLGKHAAVEELLSCADLFLMTSDRESFGLAALEALSCGVPVVGYRAGGLPEVVPHGEAGFLVPVGAVDDATEAAIGLLADDARWGRFSEAARTVAVERYGVESVLPRYEAYYAEVLGRPAGGAGG